MHTDSSRIWTWFTRFLSYNDNCYVQHFSHKNRPTHQNNIYKTHIYLHTYTHVYTFVYFFLRKVKKKKNTKREHKKKQKKTTCTCTQHEHTFLCIFICCTNMCMCIFLSQNDICLDAVDQQKFTFLFLFIHSHIGPVGWGFRIHRLLLCG